MKVIIAGSRSITDQALVFQIIRSSGLDITEVVSGGAAGVDCLGILWARQNAIPSKKFVPNWRRFGLRAGYLRNVAMADYAVPDGGLIAVWDGTSKGTGHMINIAYERNLRVVVHRIKSEDKP